MKNRMDVELTEPELGMVEVYERLEAILRVHGDDLAPFVKRNGTKALAALWQVMNGLDMDPGQVYDVGA